MAHDLDDPFSTDVEDLATFPGELLVRCANLFRRHQRAALRKSGLSPTQDQVLYLLARIRPGHTLRATDLARALRIHPVLMSRLVRLFEQRGWAQRTPDPADRRASFVALTAAGRAKQAEVRTTLNLGLGNFFAPIGREEKGLRRLLTVLLREHDPDREVSKSVRERREERRLRRVTSQRR